MRQLKKLVVIIMVMVMAVAGLPLFSQDVNVYGADNSGVNYTEIYDENNKVTGSDGIISVHKDGRTYLYFSVEPAAIGYSIKSTSVPTIEDLSIATVVQGTPPYYLASGKKVENENAAYYVDTLSGKAGITKLTTSVVDSNNITRTRTYTLVCATSHVEELNLEDIYLYIDSQDVSGKYNEKEVELNATNEKGQKVYFGEDITFGGRNKYYGKYFSIEQKSDGKYYVSANQYGTEQIDVVYNNMDGFFTMKKDENGSLVPVTYQKISKKLNIHVLQNILSLGFSQKTMEAVVGQKIQQSFSVMPKENVTDKFTWTSSNPAVAEVDANGNVTALSVGTAEIKVKAMDKRETSASYTVHVKTNATKNIKTSNKENGIEISWDGASDAVSYNIYRAENNTGNFKRIGMTDMTQYVDLDVDFGTTYTYRVTVVPASGSVCESDYSEVSSILRKPNVPKIESIKKVGSMYRITISGQLYDGFIIYGGMNPDTTTQRCVINKKQSDVNFFQEGFYKYIRVRAYGVKNGETYYSDYSEYYTYDNIASVKPIVKKAKLKGKKLSINIRKVINASGYKVTVSKKKNKKKVAVYTKKIKKNKKKLSSSKFAKGYYVRVRAYTKVDGVTKYGKWSSYKRIK